MGQNKASQTRSRRAQHRVTSEHADFLHDRVDRLIAELGIKPNPPSEPVATDDGFGFFEVLAGFGLCSLVGLLNVYY
jgi:hypothetical protein